VSAGGRSGPVEPVEEAGVSDSRPMSENAAARAAAVTTARAYVRPGMTIGLGSGRAVFALTETLAGDWTGRASLRVVVASPDTATRARAAGLEVVDIDEVGRLDLAIDGADEVDPRLNLLKGGGAALLREKLVMACADRVLIVAEWQKHVERLGSKHSLPVEVVRFGWVTTMRRLLTLVPDALLRRQPDGDPVVTSEGHYLVDCRIPPGDIGELAAAIKATLGVVEHGLFLGIASGALLGHDDGTVTALGAAAAPREAG
jgi:ribose 5-phosphate isomerase A